MSDKPEHTRRSMSNISPSSAGESYLRQRGILASLVIFAGGIITFIVWTLPLMNSLSSPGTTLWTYIIVFSPTVFTMLALLLGFMIWWTGIDSGWWGTRAGQRHKATSSFSQKTGKKHGVVSREGSTSRPGRTTTVPLAPRRPLGRSIDALTLQQRRRKRLYQGREYKGTIHQTDLQRITSSLTQSAAPDVTSNKEVHPVLEPEEISTSFPDTSELNASLIGPSPISQPSLPVDLSPISPPPLPVNPALRLPDNESPSYETTEIPVRQPLISIYLLKEITVEVQNEQGVKRTVQLQRKRRDDGKYTQRELLAYVASRRGQPVARDKLLESVFAYGLPDDRYSLTSLTNQFNKCTQFLRQDINKVAAELGIPPLTIISSTRDEWRLLTEECRVVDIDEVERRYTLIEGISGDDSLKPAVQMACQALIDAYRGDFLENYVESAVRDGGDDWVDSWIRQPYTLYRTKYFQALWYRAEFWRIKGDLSSDTSEAERTLQRNWYEMAAKLYREYALHMTTDFTDESAMLFDLEIKQRVSLGERALRAGLDMYAATKNTQAGDALYLTFAQRMAMLSLEQWRPRADTVEAWKKLKEQTKSHRFSPRVTPHDLSQGEEGA